ncbi:E3 ubiquitin-protein ligase [Forsythia ovata]|uniref:E3 ubiquitin-protein ligase n=1 Tax=Forsythia ovata TaxID=205694 RepID=A0ABD1S6X2_9LAMI
MGAKQTKYRNYNHSDSFSCSSSAGNSINSNQKKLQESYTRIDDDYRSLEQVKEALAQSGLESSNLIIGIDFTKSNEWTGKHSFNQKSLHHIGQGLNPYEHAISIIGRMLSAFDEDNLIPCFGFGDVTTHDQDVFSFYPDNKPCNGFEEVLSRYREIVPTVRLAGPTSYAPIIETAIGVVDQSGGQYHVLLIIVDGQVTRSVDTIVGQLSPQERSTVDAIVKASNYPLSIVLVGVGDGPWQTLQEFDDNIPARDFDNIQFVNFTEIMMREVPLFQKEAEFALAALMEIPLQYRATLELQLLGNRRGIPAKVPLPPPPGNFRSSNPPANYFRSSSFENYFTASCPPSPTPPESSSSNRVCCPCSFVSSPVLQYSHDFDFHDFLNPFTLRRTVRFVAGTSEILHLDVDIGHAMTVVETCPCAQSAVRI